MNQRGAKLERGLAEAIRVNLLRKMGRQDKQQKIWIEWEWYDCHTD